jgi:hypothetical protein
MKKMLTVSILTDFLQNKYKRGAWITYEEFLQRNEYLVKAKCDMPYLKRMNGLTQNTFFGISSFTVLDKSLSDVECEVIEKWNRDIGEI